MLNQAKPLSRQKLMELLAGTSPMPSVYVFDTLDSTNRYAKSLVLDGIEGPALIVAGEQTAGRGRMGRSFYSPSGSGVYFSLLYITKEPLESAVRVTSIAAVAVMRAIRAMTGKQTQIKWVNDLYLNGKKVCGILAESVCVDGKNGLIVGIGVNWHHAEFPKELSSIAGTVGAPDDVDRMELVARVWMEMNALAGNDSAYLEEYRAHSAVLGKEIRWERDGEVHLGVAEAIDQNGALIVRGTSGEREVLFSGEITVRFVQN